MDKAQPSVTLKHPAQDESLDDASRKYAGNLSHLLARELATHADRFEGYARDDLGCPGQVVYRLLVNGHLHRAAMCAAHMLAQTSDEAEAEKLIDEAAARWAKLAKKQFESSRERVLELDEQRGGRA